ncbi:MAG: hypothetical protein H0X28_15425 [Solirubrobacterales bacterium]|nr:hypothetical protein [Solirubrobacterales bacterium]
MIDIRFSLIAAGASLAAAVLAAVKGVAAVAVVFGLLALGFLLRALQGRRPDGH